MSNLNEQDLAKWHEKQERKGLFEVKLLKIPVFHPETGEEIREDEQYTVCSKTIGSLNYPCYDKRTADELCSHLNTLTSDLMLNKTLPKELLLIDDCEVYDLGKTINEKHVKLEELATAIEHELNCELSYIHRSNSIKLYPEKIKEELGLSKLPTEKQTQAYIEEKLSFEFDMWKIAKGNTSLIRQQLDYINDRVSFEKYSLRTRWIK